MSNWNNDLASNDGTYSITFARMMLRVHYCLPCDVIDSTVEAAAIFVGFFRPEARMTLEEAGENIEADYLEMMQEQNPTFKYGSYMHQATENGWSQQNDDPKDDPRDL